MAQDVYTGRQAVDTRAGEALEMALGGHFDQWNRNASSRAGDHLQLATVPLSMRGDILSMEAVRWFV